MSKKEFEIKDGCTIGKGVSICGSIPDKLIINKQTIGDPELYKLFAPVIYAMLVGKYE